MNNNSKRMFYIRENRYWFAFILSMSIFSLIIYSFYIGFLSTLIFNIFAQLTFISAAGSMLLTPFILAKLCEADNNEFEIVHFIVGVLVVILFIVLLIYFSLKEINGSSYNSISENNINTELKGSKINNYEYFLIINTNYWKTVNK